MTSLFLFIGIISSLVIIHELGHFIAAKRAGMKVEEFGLGLPPKMFGKKIGDTLFTFNLLPFGGFVRIKGEENDNNDEDSFDSKSPLQRAIVIVAGVFMNIVLAVIIFYIVIALRGGKSEYFPILGDIKPSFGKLESVSGLIAGVSDDSKISKDFVKNGDFVYSVNQTNVTSNEQLRELVNNSQGEKVNIVLKNLKDNSVVKETEVELLQKDGRKALGIYLGEAGRVSYEGADYYLSGFLHSANVAKISLQSLGLLISESFKAKDISIVSENVAGPVGIYSVVDSINESNGSAFNLDILDLVGILSLSLAIMNILPIPAVDGGRLVFIIYEMIFRKRISPRIELAVNKFGMLFLLFMLFAVTFKDISNLFFR